MFDEDRVRRAFESGQEVCAQISDGTDEVLVSHHEVREGIAEDDSEEPGSDKTLDGLFGRELDELGAAEGDAADVGEDVVCDD